MLFYLGLQTIWDKGPAHPLFVTLSKVYWGKGASETCSFHTLAVNAGIQAVKAHVWFLQTKSRSLAFMRAVVAACPQVDLACVLPDQPSTTTQGLPYTRALLKGGWLRALTLTTGSQHSPSAARCLDPPVGQQHNIMNHSRRVQKGL